MSVWGSSSSSCCCYSFSSNRLLSRLLLLVFVPLMVVHLERPWVGDITRCW